MKLTIASGKGGTGKTTVSTNLASYLSDRGIKTVLSDLDVEEPNSKLFLKTILKNEQVFNKMVPEWDSQECTMCGECETNCNFNAIVALPSKILVVPELCHSCYACSELCPTDSLPMKPERIGVIREYKTQKFDFIEGRLDLGQEMAVPLIGGTIKYTEDRYEDTLMIFDAPPGTSCPVIEASKDSDFVILITESTPFGLNDLVLAVETMKILKKEFGVVINRHGIGNDAVEEYCKKENIKIISKIKNSKKVAELYSKGELVYPHIKEFENSIKDIADFLEGLR